LPCEGTGCADTPRCGVPSWDALPEYFAVVPSPLVLSIPAAEHDHNTHVYAALLRPREFPGAQLCVAGTTHHLLQLLENAKVSELEGPETLI
jgi:hypothetical protein